MQIEAPFTKAAATPAFGLGVFGRDFNRQLVVFQVPGGVGVRGLVAGWRVARRLVTRASARPGGRAGLWRARGRPGAGRWTRRTGGRVRCAVGLTEPPI